MTAIARFFETRHMVVQPTPWLWDPRQDAGACWRAWARETSDWLAQHGADVRTALVIVPVGALLPLARQGWADAVGGWLPRIETVAALADAQAWMAPTLREADEHGLPPLTLDAVVDRLQAARSLGREAWGKQWAARDRRGFEFALDQVVASAQGWLRRLQAVRPEDREAYVAQARTAMGLAAPPAHGSQGGQGGPGGRERLLLAWALEWAAATALSGLPGDALFALRPSALVVVTAGETVAPGTEIHLTLALMAHWCACGVPVCWRAAVGGPLPADAVRPRRPTVRGCDDAEDEARQAAAQLIEAVSQARQACQTRPTARAADPVDEAGPPAPVALIALDRSLVRRVRAMLDGAGLVVADETGWLLSTTRAGAALSRLLQAASPRASTDELLDWLKSGWVAWHDAGRAHEGAPSHALDSEPHDARSDVPTKPAGLRVDEAVGELEVWCRRHGMLGAWGLQVPKAQGPNAQGPQDAAREDPGPSSAQEQAQEGPAPQGQLVPGGRQAMPRHAAQLWHWAHAAVKPLQALWSGGRASLHDWLQGLHAALHRGGVWQTLAADPAGELALDALRLTALQSGDAGGWTGLSSQTRLDGPAFGRWVATVLEATTFRPAAPPAPPDVVITPLARAVLRPFHAIVLPGADERQLGALATQTGWLSTRLCEAMDLATPAVQRAAQWDAFHLLMSRPGVVCLYRRARGSEPLEASAWLERWSTQEGQALPEAHDACVRRVVEPTPVGMPAPSLRTATWALPSQLTATSYEALRQCPYRFFATGVLGLREQDELEEGLDRSDFGTWLHEVLRRFHVDRQAQLAFSSEDEDVRAWLATADAVIHENGLDRDSQRPYFLPFKASLERLARAYVRWLRGHEEAGWSVRDTEWQAERELTIQPGLSLRLHGVLDRVDSGHQDGRRQRLVLDYKTGSQDALKRKVAAPLEDTQLAFYAALSATEEPLMMSAAYLHLDAQEVKALAHPDVAESADVLLDGIVRDWSRLHAGAPMPALGEGSACAFCQARGLCRKDHWVGDTDGAWGGDEPGSALGEAGDQDAAPASAQGQAQAPGETSA